MVAVQGRRTAVVRAPAHRPRVVACALRVAFGSLVFGLMSGCVVPVQEPAEKFSGTVATQPYVPDQQALMRYITGQTDGLPPGLPPDQAESWQQMRTDVLAKSSQHEALTTAGSEALQAHLRLPEGYSDSIAEARIPRPVVITTEFAAGSKTRAALADHPTQIRANQYSRIRVIRALLQAKVLQRILPTDDRSSPLVTSDTLFLHVEHTEIEDSEKAGRLGLQSYYADQYVGVLRDGTGKEARSQFEVVDPVSMDRERFMRPSAQRERFDAQVEGLAKALGPAIIEC